jgi:hypothetical protein
MIGFITLGRIIAGEPVGDGLAPGSEGSDGADGCDGAPSSFFPQEARVTSRSSTKRDRMSELYTRRQLE